MRPDLPIPLPPLSGFAAVFRRGVIGLKNPSFSQAHQTTGWWLASALVLLTLSHTVIVPEVAPFVRSLVLATTVYVMIRAVALAVYERQQRTFETGWIEAQSDALRDHAFDVVRFTLQTDGEQPAPVGGLRRQVLNLTDPDDIGWLFRQQLTEGARDGRSRAEIVFTYWLGPGEDVVVDQVRRELKDITLHPMAAQTPARVRFPEARYGVRQTGGGSHRWRSSGRSTYWFLGGPLRLTVSAPDRPSTGPGFPGAGPQDADRVVELMGGEEWPPVR